MTEAEKEIVCFLQVSLPLVPRPYLELANKLGVSEEEVLDRISIMQKEGKLKRIAAALFHEKVGYKVNSMVVWDVDESRLEDISKDIKELPYVTHCYSRNPAPDFMYNYYTMIHAHSENELEQHLKEMEGLIKPQKYESLKTVRELKKKSMRYCEED